MNARPHPEHPWALELWARELAAVLIEIARCERAATDDTKRAPVRSGTIADNGGQHRHAEPPAA
jgi:hypothetical protein